MQTTPPHQRDPRGRQAHIGLSMDRDGQFFIQGEPVTHRRTQRALLKNLFVDEDGSICTRIGYEWSKIEVADTPLLVLGVSFEAPDAPVAPGDSRGADTGPDKGGSAGMAPWLALSDGRAERLQPRTLWLEGERLYCLVRHGRFAARFVPRATADLLLRALAGDEEHPVAVVAGQRVDLTLSKRASAGR